MSKLLLIGTTAINRPILHSDIFFEWIEWILKCKESNYDIKWFINIDYIQNLKVSIDDTVTNLKNINNNRINISYIYDYKKGNFLNACKRLSTMMKNYSESSNYDETKILWLEDDWKLNVNSNKNLDINFILNNLILKRSVVNLTFIRNNYIHALAPCIMNFKIWYELFYNGWNKQKENIDPEHCIGKYYVKNYGKYKKMNNLTILNQKKDISNQNYMKYENSFYSVLHNDFKLDDNEDKFLKISRLKRKFINSILYIRISPTFCIGGCNYGREFLKKYNIIKDKTNNDEFYNTN